jgi:3'-phosphoadenosine 5'-phosphosulfate sulfotransferase (PAPS reductase)/FAD synthetase
MNIVSVSGGKDSTAMLLRMIDEGIKIDRILFADTGLELPETYFFINRLSCYCESRIGVKITTLRASKGWDYYFYRVRRTGKYKGLIRG